MAVDAPRRRHTVAALRETPGPAPAAVLAQAREMIVANERLDMARLSAELGVDRTTLFRWVGNRDQLLVEVIWSVIDPLFRDCVTAADGTGASYISRVLGRWVVLAHRSPELRAIVARDPERALRLLAGRDGDVYRRMVAAVEKLLQQERASGCLPHPVALAELAELVVRTVNSWVWSDLIAGDPPDAVSVQVAVGLLLRPRQARQ